MRQDRCGRWVGWGGYHLTTYWGMHLCSGLLLGTYHMAGNVPGARHSGSDSMWSLPQRQIAAKSVGSNGIQRLWQKSCRLGRGS